MSMPFRMIEMSSIDNWTGERATKRIEIPTYSGMQELFIHSKVNFSIATAISSGSARGAFGAIRQLKLIGDGSDDIWSLSSLEQKWLAHHWMRNIPQESTLLGTVASHTGDTAQFTLPMMVPHKAYSRVELIIESGDIDVDVVEEDATSVTTLDRYDIQIGVKYKSDIGERFYCAHAEDVLAASSNFVVKPPLGYTLHGAIVFTFDNSATPADADDCADNIESLLLKHSGTELYNMKAELAQIQTADIWNVDRDSLLQADGSTISNVYLVPIDKRVATTNTYLTVETNGSAGATDSVNVLWLMSTPVKASATEI